MERTDRGNIGMIIFKMPWAQPPLDKWDIEEISHFPVDGEKHISVQMSILHKDGSHNHILEEGPDDNDIWRKLYEQAMEFEK